MIEFALGHVSEQEEAHAFRRVECEINAVALGSLAHLMADCSLGSEMTVTGFLAARSLKNRTAVLHVTAIEFQEGTGNGFQTA